MPKTKQQFTFFIDDFGTRTMCKPEVKQPIPLNEYCFGLGGIIVPTEAIDEISSSVANFCNAWNVPALHGNKIRSGKGKFSFLKDDEERRAKFFTELESLLSDPRITAHACVICRLGYRDRYLKKYQNPDRWEMSRTAFDISVERAAKYARLNNRLLSVAYERAGKIEDRLIERYFSGLKNTGTEFSKETSAIYAPLSRAELSETLIHIWPDGKNNPLLQLADLIIHPLCNYSTKRPDRAYDKLMKSKQLIDFKHDDPTIAIKYSCFDEPYNVWIDPKKT